MESKANFTLIGAFVLVAVFALLVAGFWLTAGRHTKEYRTFAVYMHEPVYGLNEQSPVEFNGVHVGYVKTIELNPDNPLQVRLILDVEENTPVTKSTVATLRPQGITGITYVSLQAKTSHAPLLELEAGQRYPIIPSEPSFLVQLDKAIRDVSSNMKDISESFKLIFEPDNQIAVRNSLKNIAEFSYTLSNNAEIVEQSIKDMGRLLHNSAIASEELPHFTQRLSTDLNQIRSMAKHLQTASQEVTMTMRDSRVAIKNMSQQAVPNMIELMQNLQETSHAVAELSRELEHDPSMMLRGKAPASPGPGE